MSDHDDQLLAYVRLVAAVVTLALFVYAVLVGRDAGTLGVLVGALALWLGIASYEALKR